MNLMTRETRYQKHEAPKCRTLGFLCVSVRVLVFSEKSETRVVGFGQEGGTSDLRFCVLLCF